MSRDSFEHPIDWDELDRLVDGKLDSFEYRQLLQRIDEHPEGWRRCALAFLEHQAFGSELTELAEGSKSLCAVDDSPQAIDSPAMRDEKNYVERPTKRSRGSLSAMITMTACVLVGLAVGNSAMNEMRDSLPPSEIAGSDSSEYAYGAASRFKFVGAPASQEAEPFRNCDLKAEIGWAQ